MIKPMRKRVWKPVSISVLLIMALAFLGAANAWAYRDPYFFSPYRHASQNKAAIKAPPHGCAAVKVGGVRYHYRNGIFYQKGPRGFSVVAAPMGAVVASRPGGCVKIVVGGVPYFRHNGVYYQKVKKGYKVVPKPRNVVAINDRQAINSGDKVRVSVGQLNIRSGPGKKYKVKTVVVRNKKMKVLGSAPNWLYVKYSKNRYGWVKAKFVDPVYSAPKG